MAGSRLSRLGTLVVRSTSARRCCWTKMVPSEGGWRPTGPTRSVTRRAGLAERRLEKGPPVITYGRIGR